MLTSAAADPEGILDCREARRTSGRRALVHRPALISRCYECYVECALEYLNRSTNLNAKPPPHLHRSDQTSNRRSEEGVAMRRAPSALASRFPDRQPCDPHLHPRLWFLRRSRLVATQDQPLQSGRPCWLVPTAPSARYNFPASRTLFAPLVHSPGVPPWTFPVFRALPLVIPPVSCSASPVSYMDRLWNGGCGGEVDSCTMWTAMARW
ncbi:hypothetical protein DFP72DRAFT_578230 [Ephemerocybe angulata]|uniref:Uncharacterized protein n=1 Tax=Ephemerocybe angulata TaxID=980116 RepID=A0A8H6LY32_9AGAR|nr:hypothetical protein DFP72DRAFT_578230 [Tulosesus angulatus]